MSDASNPSAVVSAADATQKAAPSVAAPSISDARRLPIEVVDLRTVKIGDGVYTLDRDITVPAVAAVESSHLKEPARKKAKAGKHFLEIKWHSYDGDEFHEQSMFADEMGPGGLSMSRVFSGGPDKSDEGETHEHGLAFCLVDDKSEHRKVLVEIDAYYWIVPVNLMHFNVLSQDLANFCSDLWVAAGRNVNQYCGMSIEFGESKYSGVKISTLVNSAVGIKGKKHVLYVNNVKMNDGATLQDSIKLLGMIFTVCPAIVISYLIDLRSLGIHSDYSAVGFERLRGSECFVGPNKKFSVKG